LADALNKMPSQLSGGHEEKNKPGTHYRCGSYDKLYDEPTTGLDPITSDEISSLINDVQKKYKPHPSSSHMILNVRLQQQTGLSC